MFYNKIGRLSRRVRNSNNVASYDYINEFDCDVQSVWPADWFDWATMYKLKKMFTDYIWFKNWDKVEIDDATYIVKSSLEKEWMVSEYSVVFIQKSEWN